MIYADFMKIDRSGRLVLDTLGTYRDLEANGITLSPGLKLVFYNPDEDPDGEPDDLVVHGVVDFSYDTNSWVADIDWQAIKNISKLSEEEKLQIGLGND